MMTRAQKLQILGNMDDGALSSALSAVGISQGEDADSANDLRDDVDEQLSTWNALRVPFGGTGTKAPLWLPRDVLLPEKRKPSTPTNLGFRSDVVDDASEGDYGMYAGDV